MDVAERERADVIITGRHSRPRHESVSDSLLHNGRMAVLIAPNPVPGARFEAFPSFDGSSPPPTCPRSATRRSAPLRPSPRRSRVSCTSSTSQTRRCRAGYEEASIVAKLRQLLPERWALPVSTEVIFGRDPAVAIAGAAERIDADTICVASHARGGLARMALGSVTDELLKATHRPVLVVRPSEE